MPKKIDHKRRKREILNVALESFSTKGYESTTLSDIAKACGIARPTLYQYFHNKQQILFFASKQFTDTFIHSYEAVAQNKMCSPLERLRLILSQIVEAYSRSRKELVSLSAFVLKLERENQSISKLIQKRSKPLRDMLKELVDQAVTSGHIAPMNTDSVVNLFICILNCGIIQVLLFPKDQPSDDLFGGVDLLFALLQRTRGESRVELEGKGGKEFSKLDLGVIEDDEKELFQDPFDDINMFFR